MIETRDESTAQRDIRPIHTDVSNVQTKQEVTGLYINTNTEILLQTARATASRTDSGKSENVRILLDSASQRTFISTELKEKLNLPTLGKEKLLIKTFGSEESELKSCDIVKLCLKLIHDDVSIYLTAYAVDVICSLILNQPVRFATENYEHLEGLKLTENSYDSDSKDINILLGTDVELPLRTDHLGAGRASGHTQ